jgi:hypothetical protein
VTEAYAFSSFLIVDAFLSLSYTCIPLPSACLSACLSVWLLHASKRHEILVVPAAASAAAAATPSSAIAAAAAAREAKLAALEQEYINQTQLRAVRMKQLEALNEQQACIHSVVCGMMLNRECVLIWLLNAAEWVM